MIHFFATRPHFVNHMLPIFEQFKDGEAVFTISKHIKDYVDGLGIPYRLSKRNSGLFFPEKDGDAIVVCAANNAMFAKKSNPRRKIIFMEHGVGITFPTNQGYAGGGGIRRSVSLFLAPNQHIYDKTKKALPGKPQVIIGTPYMDKWVNYSRPTSTRDMVTISFHWNGSTIAPEAGNAVDHYLPHLEKVMKFLDEKRIDLAGHGHPRILEELRPAYEKLGIHIIENFQNVLEYSSAYINDGSSTLYEAALIMPVVLLNAPWFRKDIDFGIRWWKWTNIGEQCETPEELPQMIVNAVYNPFSFVNERSQMQRALYPYWGESAKRAALAIKEFVYNGKVIS